MHDFPWLWLVHTLFSTLLVAGGAGTLNQYVERRFDAQMRRTARRPLAAGRLKPGAVLWFGIALASAPAKSSSPFPLLPPLSIVFPACCPQSIGCFASVQVFPEFLAGAIDGCVLLSAIWMGPLWARCKLGSDPNPRSITTVTDPCLYQLAYLTCALGYETSKDKSLNMLLASLRAPYWVHAA
jgi:hypothetical protein